LWRSRCRWEGEGRGGRRRGGKGIFDLTQGRGVIAWLPAEVLSRVAEGLAPRSHSNRRG